MGKPIDMINNGSKGKILHFKQDHSFYAKQGDIKRSQNDPVRAVSRYYEALALAPDDYETRLAAAEVLTDMQRFNDSNRLLIPYLTNDEYFLCEALCIIGFNLLGLNEPEGAESCFNRFFGMTDEVSERTDAILDALDFIDSLDADPPALLQAADERAFEEQRAKANEAFGRGDYKSSASILSALSEERPEDKDLLYDLALSCFCGSDHAECGKHVDRLLELDGENWGALCIKLMLASGARDELLVKKLCAKLAKCDSSNPDELFRINGALLESGSVEQALPSAQKLVELLPYDTLANHRLAVCLAKLGRFEKASKIYAHLLKIDRNDHIASYYRSLFAMHGEIPEENGGFAVLQYQLPLKRLVDTVNELVAVCRLPDEELKAEWESSAELKDIVRWAFGIREVNLCCAMLNLLERVGTKDAQLIIKEVISDAGTEPVVVNAALRALKRLGAEMPYYAILNGKLVEGKVRLSISDIADVKVPKRYMEIFTRFRERAKGRYGDEIVVAGSHVIESYFASLNWKFRPLSKEQSEAMSAAIECIACSQSGVELRRDIFEVYGVTERRLANAIEKIVSSVVNDLAEEETEDPE